VILVTGGCGFIGAGLVRRLLADGAQVLVVDNFHTAGLERLPTDPRLEIIEADVRHTDRVKEVFRRAGPDEVIHLAALHYIPYCDEHPIETLEVNARGTRSVIEAAVEVNISRFLLASSAAVYPISDAPSQETIPPAPVDVYGYSKWMAEAILQLTCRSHDLSAVALRLFNVYGPGETNPHVIPHIIDEIRAGGPIRLGNLESRRDYIFIDDAVEAICRVRAAAGDGYSVLNVGTGSSHSVRDVIRAFEACLNRRLEIRSVPDLVRQIDRPDLRADPTLLESLLDWSANTTLEQGISRLVASERLE
jgi:UDP-glucose 4-epimerase